jgi:hypothetical protein
LVSMLSFLLTFLQVFPIFAFSLFFFLEMPMDPILRLPPIIQFFLIFAVFGLVGVLGPSMVRRSAKGLAQKEHHDVLGIMFSVAAAFYGVVLAFVIVAAWQNFQDASAREQSESLALVELYVLSTRLPHPVQESMVKAIRDYITDALTYEWSDTPTPRPGRHDLVEMFGGLLTLDPQTNKQTALYGKAMDEVTRLFEARAANPVFAKQHSGNRVDRDHFRRRGDDHDELFLLHRASDASGDHIDAFRDARRVNDYRDL